jgi:uncharacterized protein YqgC (DUF456 family)
MPEVAQIVLWVLAAAAVVIGIVGIVAPVLPGVPVVFLGLVLGAWAGDFQRVGWLGLGGGFALMLVSFGVDWAATVLGVQKLGASKLAVFGAFIGGIVGLFFNVVGVLIGPFIGAVIGELISARNIVQAGKVGLGTFLGMVIGAALKIGLVVGMLGFFALDYFVN